MSEPAMRLFVALELSAQVRRALGEISQRLRLASPPGVRWADVNGIHLTLKFIGKIPANRLSAVEAELAGVHRPSSTAIVFRGLGWFPNAQHPRVLWAGVEADSELAELAVGIERALEPLGIPREGREFRPHLTLARIKEDRGLERLRQEVQRLGAPKIGRAEYREFDLMESRLRPQGALYTRVKRFAFAGAPATDLEGTAPERAR